MEKERFTNTKVEVTCFKAEDPKFEDGVCFFEPPDEEPGDMDIDAVSRVKLSGEFEKTYYFVTAWSKLTAEDVLIEGDKMIVCFQSKIITVDLVTDEVRVVNDNNGYMEMFGIYRFKNGYFVHGELFNRYFDKDFNLKWECGGEDIFVSPDQEKNGVSVHDDFIAVWDFLGNRYYYDETGEVYFRKRKMQ